MLIRKKISSNRKIVLFVILAAIVLVILYLLYTNFMPAVSLFAPAGDEFDDLMGDGSTGGETVTVKSIKTQLETDFLAKSPYIDLKQSGQLPVEAGQPGRDNPFAPFVLFVSAERASE